MKNLKFCKAEKQHIAQLKELWALCFDEKQSALNLFFERNFDNMSAYVVFDNNKAVSALYLIDCTLNGQKSHYLCGASTSPEYRGLGIMGQLIEYALCDAKKHGDVYSLLLPATDSLYSFYKKFGYTENCSANVQKLTRSQLEQIEKTDIENISSKNIIELQTTSMKNNFVLWSENFINFATEYYKIYGAKAVCQKQSFAIFDENDNVADVFYSVTNCKQELFALLLKNTNADYFKFISKADKTAENKVKFGMIKTLDNNCEVPKDVFIGITLS